MFCNIMLRGYIPYCNWSLSINKYIYIYNKDNNIYLYMYIYIYVFLFVYIYIIYTHMSYDVVQC